MNNIDYLSLDGRALRTFLTVLEERSVSAAAQRLDITQSAVSHTLNRLRLALGDPLFVRAGRGIRPTDRALALKAPVRRLLDQMQSLSEPTTFEPAGATMNLTVAANDFQRDLLFPEVLKKIRLFGTDLRLRFVPSGVPDASVLREARCDVLVTPFPPEGDDVFHVRLFDDSVVCFFDQSMRDAPRSLQEFFEADRVIVRFDDASSSLKALSDLDVSQLPAPVVSVPNFGALRAFLIGTTFLATELSLMSLGPLAGLQCAPPPFKTRRLTMYLVWHKRSHTDPAHKWLRQQIRSVAEEVEQKRAPIHSSN